MPKKSPNFSTIQLNPETSTITYFFHDDSRLLVELASGNPLFTRHLSNRRKDSNSHAARFKKDLISTELFNNRLYMKLKGGVAYEHMLDEIPVDKRLPASIIESIKKSGENNGENECQIFVGHLFPNHYKISIDKASYSLVQPHPEQPTFRAKVEFEVKNNLFIASLWSTEHPMDMNSRLALVNDAVQGWLDVMAFSSGFFYFASISAAISIDNEILFEYPNIKTTKDETDQWLSDYKFFINPMKNDKSWYIGYAIRDMKLAALYPRDIGFYCRRALESLTHHIGFIKNLQSANAKKRRWEELVGVIDMDDDTFTEIKSIGGDERHGDNKGTSTEQQRRFITQTRGAIINYIIWLNQQEGESRS